jgi:hypothetical protein
MIGPFRVRMDPWAADYGAGAPVAEHEPEHTLELGVEVPVEAWAPIVPPAAVRPRRVALIDGVRRIDARVHVFPPGEPVAHGAFASFAAGAAIVEDGRASLRRSPVERRLIFGGGHAPPEPIRVRSLVFAPMGVEDDRPEGPLDGLQRAMRAAEAELARSLCAQDTVVIADGPLRFDAGDLAAFGYVKRIQELYLPPDLLPVLTALPRGGRTPIFTIDHARKDHRRCTWFERLATGPSELFGLARVEARERPIDELRAWADALATLLPDLAPPLYRDPRAPQNLLPIGALEARMRADLGDERLVRRWIAEAIEEIS